MNSLVPKPLLEESQKVEFIYAAPNGNKKKYNIPCPACKQVRCGKHCNNCGVSIDFRQDEKGRWWLYLTGTDIVHYNPEEKKGCMNQGTRDGKYKDVNGKRYFCNKVREDDFNRYYEVSVNGEVKRVIEKKQYWHKMTPEQFRESIMTKNSDEYKKKMGQFTFEY